VVQFERDSLDESPRLSYTLTRRFPGGARTSTVKLLVTPHKRASEGLEGGGRGGMMCLPVFVVMTFTIIEVIS
jgi:hypothetical protein